MVELPGTRARSKMNEVESVVKRSWSANRLKNSNTIGGQYGDKSSTLHPFKFTTLTDTAKSVNKPSRIYSAQPKKFNVTTIPHIPDLTLPIVVDTTTEAIRSYIGKK